MSKPDMAEVFEAITVLPALVAKLEEREHALCDKVQRMLDSMPRRLVKIPEAAAHYAVSISTMRRLVREGLIKVVNVGRTVRIDITGSPEIDALVAERLARKAARKNHDKGEGHGKEST